MSHNTTKERRRIVTPRIFFWAFVIASLVGPILILPAVKASSHEVKFSLPIVPTDKNVLDDEQALSKLLGELDSFVQDAVSYLVRISHSAEQDPKFPGRFTYQADLRKKLDPTLKPKYWSHHGQPDYNLLRHNGAIYALSQAYQRNEKRNKTKKTRESPNGHTAQQTAIQHTMEQAVGYLRDNALLPVPDHKDEWLAAWERTNPNDPHSTPDTAKLGGAGLALIALGKLENIKPDSVCEDELRKLGAFVESLQNKEDGSFTCKYKWKSGPYDEWVSLYYPGEAALGMVTLAEYELKLEEEENAKKNAQKMITSTDLELEHQQHSHHHHHHGHDHDASSTKEKYSKRWLKVATNALLYLERLRRNQELEDYEPDHWALLATARLLPILNQQRQDIADESSFLRKQADLEYWLIYRHGVLVANSMVADHTTKGLEKHRGCFTYDARTCPTSTRLEGLCK